MIRPWLWFAVALCLLAGLSVPSLAQQTTQPACDPLAIDLTVTPQRTLIYASLKETLKVQAALPDRADVVLIGDSLFAGWRTDLPTAFPATAIYDFAVGGDRVPNVLWRLEKSELSHLTPSAAVLLIGTNDLGAGTPACAVAIGIRTIVEKLRALWPETQLFVLTIPPRGVDFRFLDDRRLDLNRAIATLDHSRGKVHVVPIDDDAFTCGQYYAPPRIAEGAKAARFSCANYAEDNLHFSTRGYVELGGILKDAVLRSLGKDLFR